MTASGTASDWTALRHLPRVAPWDRGRRSRTWEQRATDYAALPKEPLVITAELATPVIYAERREVHLDAILAFAAVTSHPVASSFEGGAVVPVPLELAWVSAEGLPLWASTPLEPVGGGIETREYWHKRYPVQRAEFGSRVNAMTVRGRWKEYRTPVRAESVTALRAVAIGNADEVRELLALVTHVGKKIAMGYGRVGRWTVETGTHTAAEVLAERAVPIDYYRGREQPAGVLALSRGWTPPYWWAPWWCDCLMPAAHAE